MDTGILDVLPVQAALIAKVLLELLFNEAHHRQPAGVWGERVTPQGSGTAAQGRAPGQAGWWGWGVVSLGPTKDIRGIRQVRCGETRALWATRPAETGPPPTSGQKQGRLALYLTPPSPQSSHTGKPSPVSSPTPHQSEQSTESPKPGVSTKVSFTLMPPSSISTPRRSMVSVCVKRAVRMRRGQGAG